MKLTICKFNIEFFDNFLKENHLTKKEFCKKCGISVSSLRKIYNQENVHMRTIYKIAFTYNILTKDFTIF